MFEGTFRTAIDVMLKEQSSSQSSSQPNYPDLSDDDDEQDDFYGARPLTPDALFPKPIPQAKQEVRQPDIAPLFDSNFKLNLNSCKLHTTSHNNKTISTIRTLAFYFFATLTQSTSTNKRNTVYKIIFLLL